MTHMGDVGRVALQGDSMGSCCIEQDALMSLAHGLCSPHLNLGPGSTAGNLPHLIAVGQGLQIHNTPCFMLLVRWHFSGPCQLDILQESLEDCAEGRCLELLRSMVHQTSGPEHMLHNITKSAMSKVIHSMGAVHRLKCHLPRPVHLPLATRRSGELQFTMQQEWAAAGLLQQHQNLWCINSISTWIGPGQASRTRQMILLERICQADMEPSRPALSRMPVGSSTRADMPTLCSAPAVPAIN